MPANISTDIAANWIRLLKSDSQAVWDQLRVIEDHIWDVMHNQEDEYYDDRFEQERLYRGLQRLYNRLLVILDGLGLHSTRELLINSWGKINPITSTAWVHEVDSLDCPAYTLLEQYAEGIYAFLPADQQPSSDERLRRLEGLLRKTAVLLRRRGRVPTREKDIQDIMSDYLSAVYDDYTEAISIPGNLKSFRPDGGIRSLKTAIEFKFASSENELKVALSGIFEDMAGYSGSLDWTNFFAVIYMTEAFKAEDSVHGEICRAGKDSIWKAILITGGSTGSGRSPKKSRVPSGI